MTRQRKQFKKKSNNTANNNKNICALRVAEYLRVESMVRYLHTKDDLVRAVRKAYTVRSRMSAVNAKGKSVGAIRSKLAEQDGLFYIVIVDGHVLLLDRDGQTLVDTAPRKRDRRKVVAVYAVIPHEKSVNILEAAA